MKYAIALAALCCFPGESIAETFKCSDARGRITYSNERCENQGLKDAGAVRERLTVLPAEKKPPAKSEKSEKNEAPRAPAQPPKPPTEKPAK